MIDDINHILNDIHCLEREMLALKDKYEHELEQEVIDSPGWNKTGK